MRCQSRRCSKVGGGAVVNPCCKNNPTSSRLWMLGVSITVEGNVMLASVSFVKAI